jgi:hypothetical protein
MILHSCLNVGSLTFGCVESTLAAIHTSLLYWEYGEFISLVLLS